MGSRSIIVMQVISLNAMYVFLGLASTLPSPAMAPEMLVDISNTVL
jgi:hypothetical protein